MKTFSTTPSDVRREWHVLDATGQPLGRLATQVATYLRGKHKPTYAPHLDCGDFVIVVNAAKVRLTGNKLEQKQYYHHSGYPGGMRVRSLKHEIVVRPDRVIERAVHGMLPKGPLGLQLFRHLKVYGGAEHPHEAQVKAPAPTALIVGLPASNAPYAPRAGSAVAEPIEAAVTTPAVTTPAAATPAGAPRARRPRRTAEAGAEAESAELAAQEPAPTDEPSTNQPEPQQGV